MTHVANDILIIGYGNPGRQDDGLGPALAEALEQFDLPGVTVDSDYQLTVEHAELASRHSVVIFADATKDDQESFTWTRIVAGAAGVRFSSHHLDPPDVLALSRDLFASEPGGYVLAMRGRRFGELEIGLSTEAQKDLKAAVDFLLDRIRDMSRTASTKPLAPSSTP